MQPERHEDCLQSMLGVKVIGRWPRRAPTQPSRPAHTHLSSCSAPASLSLPQLPLLSLSSRYMRKGMLHSDDSNVAAPATSACRLSAGVCCTTARRACACPPSPCCQAPTCSPSCAACGAPSDTLYHSTKLKARLGMVGGSEDSTGMRSTGQHSTGSGAPSFSSGIHREALPP